MSYSLDFRLCVVRNVLSGMSWDEATRIFGVSRDSLRRWCQKFKATGTVDDQGHRPHKTRKVDKEQLVALVERNPDATLCELADHFGVAHSVIDYHLRNLTVTRKKNHALRGAQQRKKSAISS
jgi:transposase